MTFKSIDGGIWRTRDDCHFAWVTFREENKATRWFIVILDSNSVVEVTERVWQETYESHHIPHRRV